MLSNLAGDRAGIVGPLKTDPVPSSRIKLMLHTIPITLPHLSRNPSATAVAEREKKAVVAAATGIGIGGTTGPETGLR
jgi:hypothetical protein